MKCANDRRACVPEFVLQMFTAKQILNPCSKCLGLTECNLQLSLIQSFVYSFLSLSGSCTMSGEDEVVLTLESESENSSPPQLHQYEFSDNLSPLVRDLAYFMFVIPLSNNKQVDCSYCS
jgi:hypothetical protein